MYLPQRTCTEVLRAFAKGTPGSPQRRFRFYVAENVQAAFGKKGPKHGLPRDLNALLDMSLDEVRREFGPGSLPRPASNPPCAEGYPVVTDRRAGDDWEARPEDERQDLIRIRQWLLSGDASGATRYATTYHLSAELPPLLYELWTEGLIDLDALRDAIPEVWINNKSPVTGLGMHKWTAMFKAAGFLSRTVSSSLHQPAFEISLHDGPPTESLIVWRGAALASAGRGMSWSFYPECAAKFAQSAADSPRQGHWIEAGVFRATIPGRAVLAVFGDHREQEVVVNPNMLRGRIELVEAVRPSEDALRRRERLKRMFGPK